MFWEKMLIFISYSRTNAYTYVCALARELKIYVCMMVIYTLCACVAHRNIYGARITMLSVCLTTSSLRAFLAYKHRYRMHSTDRTKERERVLSHWNNTDKFANHKQIYHSQNIYNYFSRKQTRERIKSHSTYYCSYSCATRTHIVFTVLLWSSWNSQVERRRCSFAIWTPHSIH